MKPEDKIKILLNIQGPEDLIPTQFLGKKNTEFMQSKQHRSETQMEN